jgi:(2Fe-2S) ferredoxin
MASRSAAGGCTAPATPCEHIVSHYAKHIFFCQNRRDDGRPCCADHRSEALAAYAKERVKALGLNGPGKVRVNKAGCLDRCELGPVAVVYPEAVWYTFVDERDIDEIVESHLRDGTPVERLLIE